jgi:hypothetical protein
MSEALHRATQRITTADLSRMVLTHRDLPAALSDFHASREGILDNDTMARQGLPGSSAERFRSVGRITGYLQEFIASMPEEGEIPVGYDLVAATVVHLFDDPEGVSHWIKDVFIADFESHVDQEIHPGQRLLSVERVAFQGFVDEVAGLRVLQSTEDGPVSSTVVDFRVGRILGVAYVATMGNCERHDLIERLGRGLERKIINAVLEVP